MVATYDQLSLPTELKNFQGDDGNAGDLETFEVLKQMPGQPEQFRCESDDVFIDEYTTWLDHTASMDEVDLEDDMHDGVFTGAKTGQTERKYVCKLCGFETQNPAYFSLVDGYGKSPIQQIKSTEEFLVSHFIEEFQRNRTIVLFKNLNKC